MKKDKCPTCGRNFEDIKDFPRIYLDEVSLLGKAGIPEKIPFWRTEDVGEDIGEKKVPAEVIDFFLENPSQEEKVHSDGYIYKPPKAVNIDKEKDRMEENTGIRPDSIKLESSFGWQRKYNYAPDIRKLIEGHVSLGRYLQNLKDLEGEELQVEEILPDWEEKRLGSAFESDTIGAFSIPDTGTLGPLEENLALMIEEKDLDGLKEAYREYQESSGHWDPEAFQDFLREKYDHWENRGELVESVGEMREGKRFAEINVYGRGPNLGSVGGPTLQNLVTVGEILYEGRLKS